MVIVQLMVQPQSGLFNIIFDHIGLKRLDSYWFGSTTLAMPSIIIMHVWRNAPFLASPYSLRCRASHRTSMSPPEIDGASAIGRFLFITLPGVAYVAMIMVIIHVLWTFNNFSSSSSPPAAAR